MGLAGKHSARPISCFFGKRASLKLSPYTRVIEISNDETCLYDTISHSVAVVSNELMVAPGYITDDIDEGSVATLKELGFFTTKQEAVREAITVLSETNKIFISIELNHSCNLRCPYCYQGNDKSNETIDNSAVRCLAKYIRDVHASHPFKEMFVKVLGGEPTLAWGAFGNVHDHFLKLKEELDVVYHLLVDTNGTQIEDLTSLSDYDDLLLTVPLTHISCHDNDRRDAKGNGTYDLILSNMNEFALLKPETKIVLRHNTDGSNYRLFGEYLKDLRDKVSFEPIISLNYTGDFNDDRFKNSLSINEFNDWISSDAIDLLLEYGFKVTIAPLMSIEECQFRSPFSLKLFCDGTIGNCAMDYLDKSRMSIHAGLSFLATQKESLRLTNMRDCLDCHSLYLCGGTKKLPCVQAFEPGRCNGSYEGAVNLKLFMQRYIFAKDHDLSHLFSVFESGESYH